MSLFVFVILVLAAASTGGAFRPDAWYRQLEKPTWTPADWVFPVVWLFVYGMIATAGWLVWRETKSIVEPAIVCWGLQLVFNAAWSWLFFGRRSIRGALVDVLLLLAAALAFMVYAWSVSPLASLLFVPYALWGTFAASLNISILRRNPRAVA